LVWSEQEFDNPKIENPKIENPNIENPKIDNPKIEVLPELVSTNQINTQVDQSNRSIVSPLTVNLNTSTTLSAKSSIVDRMAFGQTVAAFLAIGVVRTGTCAVSPSVNKIDDWVTLCSIRKLCMSALRVATGLSSALPVGVLRRLYCLESERPRSFGNFGYIDQTDSRK
jgi:hypothetical protein